MCSSDLLPAKTECGDGEKVAIGGELARGVAFESEEEVVFEIGRASCRERV